MSKIKHLYEIINNIAKVFINDDLFFIIDTEDLFRVLRLKWHLNKAGYVFNKTKGFLSRYIMDCPKNKVVDHINHDILNNSKSNLRICEYFENNFNRIGANQNSKTGSRGVFLDKNTGKYKAVFKFNGERHNLGQFETLGEAQEAVTKTRYDISNFSEIDNPNLNKELLEQKQTRDLYLKAQRFKLPKLQINCCNKRQSVSDYTTYKAFKCYLHHPLNTNVKRIPKYSITYRFKCIKCDCLKAVTYNFAENNYLMSTVKTSSTIKTINLLKKLQTVYIKDLTLEEQLASTPAFSSGNDNWFYGVPIDGKLFKKVSLSGNFGGIVPVNTIETNLTLCAT